MTARLILKSPPQSSLPCATNTTVIRAEIMDFGYPQNLSPEILKLYITQEGVRSPFSSKVTGVIFTFYAGFCTRRNERIHIVLSSGFASLGDLEMCVIHDFCCIFYEDIKGLCI